MDAQLDGLGTQSRGHPREGSEGRGYSPPSALSLRGERQRCLPIRPRGGPSSTPSSAGLPSASTAARGRRNDSERFQRCGRGRRGEHFPYYVSAGSNWGARGRPDLVYNIILRLRQVLKGFGVEIFAEGAGFELGVVICKSWNGNMGMRAVRVSARQKGRSRGNTSGCSPGFGYESGGYDPFLTLSLSIHARAASLSSSDAATRRPSEGRPSISWTE